MLLCSVLLTCLACLSGCGLIVINKTVADTSATVSDITSSPLTPTDTSGGPTETTTPPTVVDFTSRLPEAEAALDALYNIDLSAFGAMFACSADTVNIMNPEEGSPLYAARNLRNKMVCDKYKCTFFFFSSETEKMKTDLAASVKSGDSGSYYADILVLPENAVGGFLTKGLLRDLRSLPFYEIQKTGNRGAGMYVKTNYVDISAAADAPEDIFALYFNRSLTGEEGSEALYSAALSDRLTFDFLLSFIKERESLSSEGKKMITVGDEPYEFFADIAAIRSGVDFLTDSDGNIPTVGWNKENAGSVSSLLNEISAFLSPDIYDTETFANGDVLFRAAPLSDILNLYDKKTDWGILPLPYTADGMPARYNVTRTGSPVFCVSANNSRTEMTGLVLTALNAASKDWIRDQFSIICIENYMRDNDSCLALRKILEDETYRDFSYIFSPVCDGLGDAAFGAARTCLTKGTPVFDSVNKVLKKVNSSLKKVY